jgi:hypothetical protein
LSKNLGASTSWSPKGLSRPVMGLLYLYDKLNGNGSVTWFVKPGTMDIARNIKEDRQCTYNVTLRSVRVTTVAVENQYVLHIMSACLSVCILALIVLRANCIFSAPYYIVICGLSGSTIFFPYYLIKGTICGGKKKLIEHEMGVLVLSATFV